MNRTKHIRKILSPNARKKAQRVARMSHLAKDLFTTDEAITRWLKTPAIPFKGAAPIDLLETDRGEKKVEGFIRGLAYGNFQ
jgi:putative toxin-antitoxin system antitoxin component (TIGR02293 family)